MDGVMSNPTAKWTIRYVASAIFVFVAIIGLYLMSVLGVYILAAIIGLIGLIFT
jgi:hypothetical protein